ncbi:hypothetical protein ES705_04933 [subsurface metagenome]|jgi:hypothetical protein
MQKYPEINWSTLYRQMIEQYLDQFDEPNAIPITELRDRLRKN